MKELLALLLGVLFLSGATAQTSECDPALAATELADESLLANIGELACKAPSVNITAVLGQIGGTLNNLSLQQLKQLPGLVEATITVNPAALQPFFALTAKELNALLPLLTQVSAEKLRVVLPLLAEQPEGTLEKVTQFLNGVTLDKLEQLSPLFGSLTEGQVNLLVQTLNILPPHAINKLTNLVRALGPVTDVVVAGKQRFGLLPNYSSRSSSSSSSTTTRVTSSVRRVGPFVFGGRKLAQAAEACNPTDQGLEISIGLLGDTNLGQAVCKFTAAELLPVMKQLLDILLKQNADTLGNLPSLTSSIANVQPAALDAFFKVPSATLRALTPVLAGLDSTVVSAQLKALAGQSSDTITKMIFFLNNTPDQQIKILVPMFAKLRPDQITTMTNILNSLSNGQIVLALHLLSVFNFNVGTIQSNMPSTQATATASTFNIGPIRVTIGGSRSAGIFGGHPLKKKFGPRITFG